jgi:ABC-type multidrug transport system fused ATPase/permease subunit
MSTASALPALFGERRWHAAGLVVTGLLVGLVEAAILALVAEVAAAMVSGLSSASAAIGPASLHLGLGAALVVAGALALARLALGALAGFFPAAVTAGTQASLRNSLYDAYSRASWEVQSREADGYLQELLTNQVSKLTLGTTNAARLLSAGLTFLALVAAAFLVSPVAAVLVLAVAAALFGLLRPLGRRGRHHARELSAAQLAYSGGIGESVRLAEEAYTFGTAPAMRARIAALVEEGKRQLFRMQLVAGLVRGLYLGLVVILLVGGLAGLYVFGVGRIAALGAVVLMLIRSASYGQQAQSAWQEVQQVAPYLERLTAAAARYTRNALPAGHRPFAVGVALHLQAVSFGYRAGTSVLRNVDVTITSGEAVGIRGSSGAGKSTLVQLLLGMRVPGSGRYWLGEVPVAEIAVDEWRAHVAYVPQEPRLLHASVADNIRFFRDIDDVAVERAACLAHIHADIVGMPDGYNTVIGQRADAVSGGQRQRICLARAMAGSPSVLVLDEPTSALDLASEAAIQRSLADLKGTITLIIVSHRPSLLETCDRVLTVQGGQVDTAGPSVPITSGPAPVSAAYAGAV